MRPSTSDSNETRPRPLAEPEPDLAALKAYNRAKQTLADEIRTLRQALLNSDEAAAGGRAAIRLAGHQDLAGWRNDGPGGQAP